jgi:dolichol-phosphate mannosyltransferase
MPADMPRGPSLTVEFAELDLAHSESIAGVAFASIAERERASVRYWAATAPKRDQRMWWRGQTVRHTFHVLPGESIIDLGCGRGGLTWALAVITRGECPITAATFLSSGSDGAPELEDLLPDHAELVRLSEFPGALQGRQFDYIVASCLLDSRHGPALLDQVSKLLKPGGRLLFFETNPWNPMFQLHRALCRVFPFLRRGDERALPSQTRLYELLSEVGFVGVTATCYDFLYWPIPRWLMRIARNLTLVMENAPGLRLLAGAILVHAQRPPQHLPRREARMVEHQSLRRAISVVIPCHNEEMNIVPLVDGLIRH